MVRHFSSRPLILTVLAAVVFAAGCSTDPQLVQLAPTKVLVSKPVTAPMKDWDTYTARIDGSKIVQVTGLVRGDVREVKFKEGDEITDDDLTRQDYPVFSALGLLASPTSQSPLLATSAFYLFEGGVLLFQLRDDDYQAELERAKGEKVTWEAIKKEAKQKVEILEPLVEKGSAAQLELVQAESELGQAVGKIAEIDGKIRQAKLNIGYCKIRGEIAGVIGKILITKGNLVDPAVGKNVLATIVPMNPAYVYFAVPQRRLEKYKQMAKKRAKKDIPVEMGLLTDKGFPLKGTVDFASPQVDEETGTVNVRANFKNPSFEIPGEKKRRLYLLAPGMDARLRVAVSDQYHPILVPDQALLTDQNFRYVFKVKETTKKVKDPRTGEEETKNIKIAWRTTVKPGRLRPDGLRVIESGITIDDLVIIDGMNRVRNLMEIDTETEQIPDPADAPKKKKH